MNIANYNVHYMLIDNGSFVDVLFYETLLKMNLSKVVKRGIRTDNRVVWGAGPYKRNYYVAHNSKTSSLMIPSAPDLHGDKNPFGIQCHPRPTQAKRPSCDSLNILSTQSFRLHEGSERSAGIKP